MIKSLLSRVVFVSALLPTASFAAEYVFTDLGSIPDQFIWATGKGLDVNSKGYIAGANIDPAERTAQIGIPGNGVIDTNTTLGGAISDAFAINDSDHLTGHSETSNGEFHAFLWGGVDMIDLGTLGGAQSTGFAINDSSQVTGGAETEAGNENAFFWDGTTMQDIGNLGGNRAHGRGISSNGFVTGVSNLSGDSVVPFHAFFWDGTTMQDLGTLGGDTSSGEAVNKHGVVAGTSELPNDRFGVAMLWADGNMISLGTLEGDTWSNAKSINSDGTVVGWSRDPSHDRIRAFVWDGNRMAELPSPYNAEAWLINDSGIIFGLSYVPGGVGVHIVRWDPAIALAIDIKPGNQRNTINPDAGGGMWVAVLSDTNTAFDPLQIKISTVRFGPGGAKAIREKVQDINSDGVADLVLRFSIREAGILCSDAEATLAGETVSGDFFSGSDSVNTVCR